MKIPKIDYKPNESLTELFDNNKELVYNRFFESIKFGVDNHLSDVYIFELGETGFFLEANVVDWNFSLDCCIDYYSLLEEFEKCLECKKMQQEISNRLNN